MACSTTCEPWPRHTNAEISGAHRLGGPHERHFDTSHEATVKTHRCGAGRRILGPEYGRRLSECS
jgi:hypothetical protein